MLTFANVSGDKVNPFVDLRRTLKIYKWFRFACIGILRRVRISANHDKAHVRKARSGIVHYFDVEKCRDELRKTKPENCALMNVKVKLRISEGVRTTMEIKQLNRLTAID